jgi:hypothetical protein
VIYLSSFVSAMQRRRWAGKIEQRAPARVTVAAAADLVGVQRGRMLELVRPRLGAATRLDTEVPRERIAAALRNPHS